ncbi:conserved hypothetical protein [delta proteobacterium NaphS2]|nr:conserved hypothetical protein [delta proteobacterium NaphS2]
MKYGVAETARILEIDIRQLKTWAYQFRDNLSASANPEKGTPRIFTVEDLLVLLYVGHFWEDEPDVEAIVAGLNSEYHLEDIYVHTLWNHTPLIQDDVPENLDEPSRHGLLISPRIHLKQIEIARSYHRAANALWDKANDSGFPMTDCYPVLFAYRHALELYLKMLGKAGKELDHNLGKELDHNLKACMEAVEKHYDKKVSPLTKEWIMTLHQMDETGWHFRYEPETEGTMDGQWLDWSHFRYAMDTLFNALDFAWLAMHR